MYSDGQSVTLWIVVFLTGWLLGLSFLVWKNNIFLKKLFPKQKGNFGDKLEEILTGYNNLEEFKKQSLEHLQKVSLKRYNPYQDTGGDQSFSVALLDGKNNGIVITSLHSRSGTRVFAKPVKDGKEDNFRFSDEERAVVKEAVVLK
ncbi:MAG: DUF4446 family protein [Candidatus Daviesbacteria bacterium]